MDPVWFEEDNPSEIKVALESDEDPSTEVSEVSSTKQNDDEEPVPEMFIENEVFYATHAIGIKHFLSPGVQ